MAWWPAAEVEPETLSEIIADICKTCDITGLLPAGQQRGVHAAHRWTATTDFLFLFNHANESAEVALPAGAWTNNADQQPVPSKLDLSPYAALVLRKGREAVS